MSEFSVALAPLAKTGTSHTSRRRGAVARAQDDDVHRVGVVGDRDVGGCRVGAALTVGARRSVGVVPEPALIWPGFVRPLLR